VITSIEHDHPDYFLSSRDVENSFEAFLGKLKPEGKVVVLSSVRKKFQNINWPRPTVVVEDRLNKDIRTGVSGEHMRLNALLAITLADQVGMSRDDSFKAISDFKGISRRLETLGKYKNMEVVSDYGHHPSEIVETMKAIREKYVGKKVLVLFEGHTADRLECYKDQYVNALSGVEIVVVVPPYLPRGRKNSAIGASRALSYIQRELEKEGVSVVKVRRYEGLPSALGKLAKNFDVAVGFSAGALDRELRMAVLDN
jgi:UDP-N-acetylmuramate--alanine ligase